MKFTNKIAYCKISFPHKGEIDFTSALNLPITYEPVLDETLDTAIIKLTDLRQADYPTIDVSKAFESFSLVRIGFEGQETEIRMLIAHDDCKSKRKDNTPWKSWFHTIQLVEETKLLERESVDVLTFTNPIERKYDSNASILWTFDNNKSCYRRSMFDYVGEKTGEVKESDFLKYVGWRPPALPMLVKKTSSYSLSSNLITYNTYRSDRDFVGGGNILFLRLTVTSPNNQKSTYSFRLEEKIVEESQEKYVHSYENSSIYIPLYHVGDYRLEYFLRAYTSKENGNGRVATDIVYYTYIAVGSKNDQIKNYTIKDILNRTLNITPQKMLSEKNKFKFDEAQLAEFSEEEAPEFAFTGHTLFEAMLLVAQYKGAFPELKDDTISFRTLWNGITLTEANLPPTIDEANSSDCNQYCTYLETEVQNLVGMNDSRVGTVVEPYAGGYKTTRSSGGSEISQDTAVIPTTYSIYQSIAVEMGKTNGTDVGDITAYVYEQGEYNALSDTSGAYPNSKGYAIEWTQMGRDYSGLAHRINSSVSSIAKAFTQPAIANIVYAKTGDELNNGVVEYLKNLVGIKNNDSFAELTFRSKYIPLLNTRIKQYKDYFGDFHHDGSIKYNQTAELVDSEMYGEHLKQLIRKIGNHTKYAVYIFDKIDDVPKIGTVVDGYSVYDVKMSIRENEVVATIFYVKYAELSQYIGVKNPWKDSDISTDKFYNRAISLNEFLLFTSDNEKQSTSKILSEAALDGIISYTTASPLTCVEAMGHYVDGSNLNTVLLPVVSLAVGNSLFFQWGYEDNYSAGYMSEKAPDGATSLLSNTAYNRAQKAVKYCDIYGRIETYDFSIMQTGPVPDGENIAWVENEEVKTDVATVFRNIGYSLPLKPPYLCVKDEEGNYTKEWQGEPYISVKDLLVEKNSSEALTFSVQLHYCTDNENFIVGSGLTNFCSLVGGEAKAVGLYGFNERINIFKRRFPVTNADKLPDVQFAVNGEKRRIEIKLPEEINSYTAWAFMGEDKNGNHQIIFGENRDLKGSDFKTELYLLPMHKLEDFI